MSLYGSETPFPPFAPEIGLKRCPVPDGALFDPGLMLALVLVLGLFRAGGGVRDSDRECV